MWILIKCFISNNWKNRFNFLNVDVFWAWIDGEELILVAGYYLFGNQDKEVEVAKCYVELQSVNLIFAVYNLYT